TSARAFRSNPVPRPLQDSFREPTMPDSASPADLLRLLLTVADEALGSDSADPVAEALAALLAAAREQGVSEAELEKLERAITEALARLPQPPAFADVESALAQVVSRELTPG